MELYVFISDDTSASCLLVPPRTIYGRFFPFKQSCSHVLQLSLDFVEDVALHLFVLAVTSVRAISQATSNFFDSLLELVVKLRAEAGRLLLLDLQITFVLLDSVMETLMSLVSRLSCEAF